MSTLEPQPQGRARAVRVRAPCKINPFLEVLGRRADGFHELDSQFVALDLADELLVARGASGSEPHGVSLELMREGGDADTPLAADATNLAVRAAVAVRALAHERGHEAPALSLTLTKRVPLFAGLGGGSADAAAAALGAALVLGLDPDDPVLLERLASLGSDCAFFLAARATGAARCRGRGERVSARFVPATFPWVVLVTPALASPTPAVYAAHAARAAEAPYEPRPCPSLAALADGSEPTFDRLEAAALSAVPALAPWRALLDAAARALEFRTERAPFDGRFVLSGSGASYFALVAERGRAQALAATVRRDAEGAGLWMRHVGVHAAERSGVRVLQRLG